MSGRQLLSESELGALNSSFAGPDSVRRRSVLRETLAAIESSSPPDRYHRLAA